MRGSRASKRSEAVRTAEQRGPKVAPKGTEHPAQLEPTATCRPARTSRAQRTRATPPQRHRRRCMATARPATTAQVLQGGRLAPRCSGSSHAPPTLPPHLPALACRRAGSHSCPPSRSAGRSQRPCPEQARGARAPSSRVVSSSGAPRPSRSRVSHRRPAGSDRKSALRAMRPCRAIQLSFTPVLEQ